MQEDTQRKFRQGDRPAVSADGSWRSAFVERLRCSTTSTAASSQVNVHPDHRRRATAPRCWPAARRSPASAGTIARSGDVRLALRRSARRRRRRPVSSSAGRTATRWRSATSSARLDLPVAERSWTSWPPRPPSTTPATRCAPGSGPVPEELLDGWAAADLGADDRGTDGRHRARARGPRTPPSSARREALLAVKQGRTKSRHRRPRRRTATWSPTPTSATTIARADRAPTSGARWSAATHRGHRLGLAVKVANLRLLQAERSDLGQVVDLQRRGQRPHDRRQRAARASAGRAARRVPEASENAGGPHLRQETACCGGAQSFGARQESVGSGLDASRPSRASGWRSGLAVVEVGDGHLSPGR